MKELIAEMSDLELEEAIIAKEHKLRLLFPEAWTVLDQSLGMRAAFGFKVQGLDWRSETEFGRICAAMHKLKIIEMSADKTKVRRADSIINQH